MPFVFSNTWFGGSRKTANYKGLFAKIKLVEAARKGEGGRERARNVKVVFRKCRENKRRRGENTFNKSSPP